MQALKSGLVGLAAMLAVTLLAAGTKPSPATVPVNDFKLPPLPALLPVQPVLAVRPELPKQFLGPFSCGCTWRPRGPLLACGFQEAQRENRIKDPLGTIARAYLKSRSVKAVLLDPEILVDAYAAGQFGIWAQDGVLVRWRINFTDEATIRQVFDLLVEGLGDGDEETGSWSDEGVSLTTAADFLRGTRFSPEMSFEFAGEAPLRVDLGIDRRMIIQSGDRWDSYTVDRWTHAALKALFERLAVAAEEGGSIGKHLGVERADPRGT